MEKTNKSIIRTMREECGLSMSGLEQATGIKKSTIASYETRGVTPGRDKAEILSQFFGVSVAVICGLEEPEIEESSDYEVTEAKDIQEVVSSFDRVIKSTRKQLIEIVMDVCSTYADVSRYLESEKWEERWRNRTQLLLLFEEVQRFFDGDYDGLQQ